jgi:transposase, IS5 family
MFVNELSKQPVKRTTPMRSILSTKPQFNYSVQTDHPEVQKFYNKYNKMDSILNSNFEILKTIHQELCSTMNVFKGRDSEYCTETIFRMLLIKCIEQLSFRDLLIRVNDSMFLRNFARIGRGNLMSIGLLNAAWKCISSSTWSNVNKILLTYSIENKNVTETDLRVDSTVCESNIHYPTDSSLLWDSYRVLARVLREIMSSYPQLQNGFRFHERKIKQLHTLISTRSGNQKKTTQRVVKRATKVLVERVETLLKKGQMIIDATQILEMNEVKEQLKPLLLNVELVTIQSRRCHIDGETVPACDRIFSIFEDHTELLKRGKARKLNEFGHMVTLGQTKEKFISYYAVDIISDHDTKQKDLVLESHKEAFGSYPKRFGADKNYYVSMDDIKRWEEKIETFGMKEMRNQEETEREHTDAFRETQKFRAGCEGSISVLKRVFGLGRCVYRTFKSFASSIGRLVFCHNIVLLATQ